MQSRAEEAGGVGGGPHKHEAALPCQGSGEAGAGLPADRSFPSLRQYCRHEMDAGPVRETTGPRSRPQRDAEAKDGVDSGQCERWASLRTAPKELDPNGNEGASTRVRPRPGGAGHAPRTLKWRGDQTVDMEAGLAGCESSGGRLICGRPHPTAFNSHVKLAPSSAGSASGFTHGS